MTTTIRDDEDEEILVVTSSTFLPSLDTTSATTTITTTTTTTTATTATCPSPFDHHPRPSSTLATAAAATPCTPMFSSPTAAMTSTLTIQVQPLLILDLNGILCHRSRLRKEPLGVTLRPAVGPVIAHTPLIPRPHWISWLTWLDRYFCLAVWTSAKAMTAHQLLKALVPARLRQRLLFVWTQNDCTPRQNEDPKDDYDHIVYEKHLSKVWQCYPLWNSHNTLLMDDSPHKSPRSQAKNVLHPPPLHGQQSQPPAALSSSSSSSAWQSDEDNEQKQHHFFRLLIQYWSDHSHCHTLDKRRVLGSSHPNHPRQQRRRQQQQQQQDQLHPPPGPDGASSTSTKDTNHTDSFYNFLNTHATGHMGWRGNQSTP